MVTLLPQYRGSSYICEYSQPKSQPPILPRSGIKNCERVVLESHFNVQLCPSFQNFQKLQNHPMTAYDPHFQFQNPFILLKQGFLQKTRPENINF